MGLDMYLDKRKKVVDESIKNEWNNVMYWRKANQVRAWFVSNIEEMTEDSNCQHFTVSKELLEKLVADCKTVLEERDNAAAILPTSSGFFFGSCNYDEWYYKDLEETIEGVQGVIDETDWETEEVAYYDWW